MVIEITSDTNLLPILFFLVKPLLLGSLLTSDLLSTTVTPESTGGFGFGSFSVVDESLFLLEDIPIVGSRDLMILLFLALKSEVTVGDVDGLIVLCVNPMYAEGCSVGIAEGDTTVEP